MAQVVAMTILLSMNSPRKSLESELANFRTDNPLIDCRGAARLQYRIIGTGADAVLWLTGAIGRGDLAFKTLPLIGRKFSIILPDYPDVPTLEALSDSLIASMDQEKIASAHVVGGSLGGMVAQYFVRRHPGRVRSLVLSHTSAPEPSWLKVRLARAAVGTLRIWPDAIVRRMFCRRLRGSFDVDDLFWLKYFDSQIAAQPVGELVSRVRLVAEFAGLRDYTANDLEKWGGSILILESDDDPMMPEASRKNLRQLYPQARVHTFSGTGHSISLTDPEQYARVIREFLESQA